jgi:hypothetical protein
MNQFWFMPKLKGYGATPTTWEGYTLVAVFASVVLICVLGDVMAGENPIDLSAADDRRSRLDNRLSGDMRVEN